MVLRCTQVRTDSQLCVEWKKKAWERGSNPALLPPPVPRFRPHDSTWTKRSFCYFTLKGWQTSRRLLLWSNRSSDHSCVEGDMLQVTQPYENGISDPGAGWSLVCYSAHMIVHERIFVWEREVQKRLTVRWENPCWDCILIGPWPTDCQVKLQWPDLRVNKGLMEISVEGQGRPINLWNYSCHTKCWDLFKT